MNKIGMVVVALAALAACAPLPRPEAMQVWGDGVPFRDLTSGDAWRGWVGTPVADVIQADDIAVVWVIEANTTPPMDINARNVVATIEHATQFETADAFRRQPAQRPLWVALLQMRDGTMMRFQVVGDWAELLRNREVGVFRVRWPEDAMRQPSERGAVEP